MATKKPTAKQLAARKAFAARVRSGEFKGARARRKNPAPKTPAAKSRAPVRAKPAAPARRRNPAPAGFVVQSAGGATVATARTQSAARTVAQALADATGKPFGYGKK